jgi:cystathionine beta-lyase
VIVPSGLAAIVIALQSCLKAGDHMLMTDSVYRPSRNFADTMLKGFGVETTYYDPRIGAGIAALMRPNTRVVFTEAPGSQTFEMQDMPAIVDVATRHGALTVMDNTWATPLFFPAHAYGVDLVIEAGTKYLGGHSDVLMGLVTANAKAWPALKAASDAMALTPAPEDCFLALRGLRTMKLRLEEAQRQAFAVAEWMAGRPEVKQVLHPGLPGDPGHALWKRDFKGASGLFGAILHPVSETQIAAFFDGLSLFGMGYSWGGYESLCVPYPAESMRMVRTATPWTEPGRLIRLQIGLEDVADLTADLAAGFKRMAALA